MVMDIISSMASFCHNNYYLYSIFYYQSNIGLAMKKQKVYVSLEVPKHSYHHIYDLHECEGEFIENVAEENGYFFTTEELNNYTETVIKEALETAIKNVELTILKKSQYSKKARWKKVSKKEAEEGVDIFSYAVQYKPSKASIRNCFKEIYQKFLV